MAFASTSSLFIISAVFLAASSEGWLQTVIQKIKNEQNKPNSLSSFVDYLKENFPFSQHLILYDIQFKDSVTALYWTFHSKNATSKGVIISTIGENKENILPELISDRKVFIKTLVFVMCRPQQIVDIFSEIRAKFLESQLLYWVILSDVKPIIENLTGILRAGTQVVGIKQEENGAAEILSFQTNYNSSIQFMEVGKLKRSTIHLKSPLFTNLEENLFGRQLLVTVIDNWPFFGTKTLSNGTIVPDSGLDFSVLSTLAKSLNFSFRMVTPEDGQWGMPQSDGSVTGMIGLVHRHEADLAIDEFTITNARESVVDFTDPYYIESSTLISPAPVEKDKTFAVFLPFNMIVLNVYEVTGTFNSTRMLYFAWALYALILQAYYSGILTSTLVAPSLNKPIDTLVDLLVAIRKGSVYAATLEGASVEGLLMVLEYGDVYIDASFSQEMRSSLMGRSKFYMAKEKFYMQSYGIVSSTGSPLKILFDKRLKLFMSSGLIDKWKADEVRKGEVLGRAENIKTNTKKEAILTLEHLQGAFVLLVIGLGVSVVALFLEVVTHKFLREQNDKI